LRFGLLAESGLPGCRHWPLRHSWRPLGRWYILRSDEVPPPPVTNRVNDHFIEVSRVLLFATRIIRPRD